MRDQNNTLNYNILEYALVIIYIWPFFCYERGYYKYRRYYKYRLGISPVYVNQKKSGYLKSKDFSKDLKSKDKELGKYLKGIYFRKARNFSSKAVESLINHSIVISNYIGELFLHQTRVIAINNCLNSLLK